MKSTDESRSQIRAGMAVIAMEKQLGQPGGEGRLSGWWRLRNREHRARPGRRLELRAGIWWQARPGVGKALSFDSRQLFHDKEGEIQGVSIHLVFNKFRADVYIPCRRPPGSLKIWSHCMEPLFLYFMFMCVFVCMQVHVCECVCLYVCKYMHMWCVWVYLYVCLYMHMCVCYVLWRNLPAVWEYAKARDYHQDAFLITSQTYVWYLKLVLLVRFAGPKSPRSSCLLTQG